MKNNLNPYVAEGNNVGSANQLKDKQKQMMQHPNPYYDVVHKTPYDIMKQESMDQGSAYANDRQKLSNVNMGYSPQKQSGIVSQGNPHYYNNDQMVIPPGPIIVNNMGQPHNYSAACQFCKSNTGVIDKNHPGCAIWSWCCVLWFFTGCCCWIPFVVDECYDREIRCLACGRVKMYIKSGFCCC